MPTVTRSRQCADCRNADSWGIPDKPICYQCRYGSRWTPLNTWDGPEKPHTCHAKQFSDQVLCPCGNGWDVNDPQPPACQPMPKPRLFRRYNGIYSKMLWVCLGQGVEGLGYTPTEAYENWQFFETTTGPLSNAIRSNHA